jgi:hypothetical protein
MSMESTGTTSPSSSWLELAAVVAAYILIMFVLCPGDSPFAFPVQRDDFWLLSSNASSLRRTWAHGLPPRPVATAIWTVLSSAGIPVFYLTLQALTILYVFLALKVSRKLFGARPMPLLLGVLVAAAALSVECIVEYAKYTGLITSLLSGVFAASAMLLMTGERESRDKSPRTPVLLAIWILCALSFWSKEDFLVPTILLAVYLAWEARSGLRWFVLTGGVICLGVLLALYNRFGNSPFTQGNTGTYKRDFSPLSVYHTAATYFFMSPVAGIAATLQASMLVWNLIAPAPVRWMRLLLVQTLILLLVLPYCFLPQHTALYYVFNWTAWQIGAALILLWNVSGRAAVKWAVALIAIVCVAVGQPARSTIAAWYRNAGQVNHNIVSALRQNAEPLRPYRAVVIEGAPFLSPFESDGKFLYLRYGLDHDWIVRVPKDSDTYRLAQSYGTRILGRVRTVAMEDAPPPAGVPVLRLFPDGTGALDLPGAPIVPINESDRVRIDRIYPDSTAAGVKFQIQPNGQSAISLAGANFQPGAIVIFNGRNLPTTYGNSGLVSTLVPDDLIARAATIRVRVLNANGDASNEIEFNIITSSVQVK